MDVRSENADDLNSRESDHNVGAAGAGLKIVVNEQPEDTMRLQRSPRSPRKPKTAA